MEYAIFYLLKGKAANYNNKLVRIIGPKFGETYLIDNPRPPHLTLKYKFELKSTKNIEQMLEIFVKKQKPSMLQINGFGNFSKETIFLRVIPSKQAIKTQKDLSKEIKRLGVKPDKFRTWHPHATLAYKFKEKRNFNKIWDDLKERDNPKFNLKFNRIALVKKVKKRWKVKKEFNFGKG